MALVAGVATPILSAPARAAGDDITGWWYDETKRGGILIEPCGNNQLCGKVGWMREPLDAAGKQKVDAKNPDDKLKTRPICQLPMLGAFNHTDKGEWEDGWIYNPEDGDTYKSRMVLQDDGTLRVRGFIGVPWLGKSQVWTRPSAPLEECKPN